jgi:hypothetical protein
MHEDEELIPLARLATLLPAVRGKKPPHRMTVYKWATKGLKSRSGHPIRLDTQFVGGTLCSSLAAVERLSRAKNDVTWVPPPHHETSHDAHDLRRRGEAAMARLRKRGFC